jgi:anoctamin-8
LFRFCFIHFYVSSISPQNVREYFGEKVALYFAWLGYYTVSLLFPALLGVLMIVLYSVRGYIYTVDRMDWYLIGFEGGIVVWAVLYKQGWDRHEKAVALKWG